MRALISVFVALIYIVFFEKDTQSYIKPFSYASVISFGIVLFSAICFDVKFVDVFFLRSGSSLVNVGMLVVYTFFMIVVVAIIKKELKTNGAE